MVKAKPEKIDDQPKSPMPEQSQDRPGIEALMDPRPEFFRPNYKGSEKLGREAGLDHGR